MSDEDLTDSETNEENEESSSEDGDEPQKPAADVSDKKITEYEKQRLHRIRENEAKLKALGMPKMAVSLMGLAQKEGKSGGKGKGKMAEDEEYRPPEGEEDGASSSSGGDDEDDDGDGDDRGFLGAGSRRQMVKKKSSKPKKKVSIQKVMNYSDVIDADGDALMHVKKKSSKPKKKVSIQKVLNNSDVIDDDDALMQAIALSLKDCSEVANDSGPSHSLDAHKVGAFDEKKGSGNTQVDAGKRKRKKLIPSHVQMTEDEVILHFYQIDEAGKGKITLRDLQKVAYAHDFTWTDKELADMIHCFDSDGNGKLNLDDFQKIVSRCNMIQRPENAAVG